MTKFRVLKYNQDFMARFGIHSHRLTEPVNEFFRSFASYFMLFHIGIFCIGASCAFVYKNINDLGLAFATCLVVVAGFQAGGMFLSVGLNMTTVKTLHLKLQNIVSEGTERSYIFVLIFPPQNGKKTHFIVSADKDGIMDLYWRTEQKCRTYSKRGTYYIMFNQLSFVASLLYSLFMIMTNSFDATKLLLPFNMEVPFDTNTLWGWYLFWFFQFNTALAYICTTVPVTVYFMCCCYYIGTICEHFDTLIQSIKQDVEYIHNENNPVKYQKMCLQIQRKFHKSISVHVTAFE